VTSKISAREFPEIYSSLPKVSKISYQYILQTKICKALVTHPHIISFIIANRSKYYCYCYCRRYWLTVIVTQLLALCRLCAYSHQSTVIPRVSLSLSRNFLLTLNFRKIHNTTARAPQLILWHHVRHFLAHKKIV